MTDAIRSLFELLTKKEKSGSDYTGTVTRVEGKTAYVRFDGADIDDTPVALSIGASPGDTVRIRVADGRAWLVGNDSAPPNDSSGVAYDLVRTNALIDAIRTERITGENGWINLLLGTFNYGNGALKWNGSELSLNGKVIAKTGEIGDFTISGGALINGNYIEISPYNNNQHSGYVKVSNEEGYSTSIRPGEVRVRNADGTIQNYLDYTGLYIKGNITVGNRQTSYNIIENGVALSDKYAPLSDTTITFITPTVGNGSIMSLSNNTTHKKINQVFINCAITFSGARSAGALLARLPMALKRTQYVTVNKNGSASYISNFAAGGNNVSDCNCPVAFASGDIAYITGVVTLD